ncbi:squalene--hopene cyclase [Bacillus sp. Bva_UNVM-123]
MKHIPDGINQIIEKLRRDQSSDGSWNYPFDTGISTDSYMIILLRTLKIDDENLIKQLTERLLSKQEENGAWKLFYDEGNGNLSITIEAYSALRYSGYMDERDVRLERAKHFILTNGGLENSHMFTKMMLAITGHMKWPDFFPLPVELILLPTMLPINFYSFSVFGRANLTPLMILADRKFALKTDKSPNLSDLFLHNEEVHIENSFGFSGSSGWRSLFSVIENGINSLIGLPIQLHKLALEKAKQYMLDRIEPDGTFYNYFSSTFLMIFSLLSLGYSKSHPVIIKAISGLKSMKCEINGFSHIQYTNASVWNTSLINYSLQEAGISHVDPMIKKANDYLVKHQQQKYGDWAVHNPHALPGGWGFQDQNTIQPDVDDTTATLRSIINNVQDDIHFRTSWERGVHWVLSMQNDDGGWPAFERNTNSKLLEQLPIEKAKFIVLDPSSADLTGRTLQFLGDYTNIDKNHSLIRAGANWLMENQEKDGSWYGRWGICYVYGTWAAITGLTAISKQKMNPSIFRAVKWLDDIQNADGGWGESCRSDTHNTYIPLHVSTLTHTAWAVDALISVNNAPTSAIKNGIKYLLENILKKDWTTEYPAGQGMGGDFYVHYHSYRYIFPLLALAHYERKYSDY